MNSKFKLSANRLSDCYYQNFYNNTANKGFNGFLFNFTHRALERIPCLSNGGKRKVSSKVLEVGAGAGQHLQFVKNIFRIYNDGYKFFTYAKR
jgi:hypothetical protein